MHGGKWDHPHYKEEEKLPWIPQEKEIDDLIAGCSLRISCFLQVMKESAIRPGEAWRLKWIDIDYENKTITLNKPEKHSRSRQFKISLKLTTMLSNIQREKFSHPERIFNYV
jgi:integrase